MNALSMHRPLACPILNTVGFCKPLALYWLRNKGGHFAWMYRARCADGVLQINAPLDTQGAVQRFSLTRIDTPEAPLDVD